MIEEVEEDGKSAPHLAWWLWTEWRMIGRALARSTEREREREREKSPGQTAGRIYNWPRRAGRLIQQQQRRRPSRAAYERGRNERNEIIWWRCIRVDCQAARVGGQRRSIKSIDKSLIRLCLGCRRLLFSSVFRRFSDPSPPPSLLPSSLLLS